MSIEDQLHDFFLPGPQVVEAKSLAGEPAKIGAGGTFGHERFEATGVPLVSPSLLTAAPGPVQSPARLVPDKNTRLRESGMVKSSDYRFSFGPWNIHEGADPFGPAVRPSVEFAKKLAVYKELGFDAVQFHDDDVVPEIDTKSGEQVRLEAKQMKKLLDDHGLVAEFTAPRLWEDARGIDGGYTSNDRQVRQWAIDRTKRCIDVARDLGIKFVVLWLAREGTYIRESKYAIDAHKQLIDSINACLAHDKEVEIAIEPKPNEPMDHAYVPTIGHALFLGSQTSDPKRMGGLIETAHAILAGLDPSDEMAFALQAGKLWSVHLNDQNGLKFDQDKSFGAANLRMAYNQVRVLEQAGYAKTGRFVGLDVKAMRTQKSDSATKHLANSRRIFLALVEKVRTFDRKLENQLIDARDYEALEMAHLSHLMGT
jgi:xylose isomerase